MDTLVGLVSQWRQGRMRDLPLSGQIQIDLSRKKEFKELARREGLEVYGGSEKYIFYGINISRLAQVVRKRPACIVGISLSV
jgi:hypothetical protein